MRAILLKRSPGSVWRVALDKEGPSSLRRAKTVSQDVSRHGSVEAKDVGGMHSLARTNKEVFMVKSALCAAIGFAAMSSIALAEDLFSATAPLPPGHSRRQRTLTNEKLRAR
jgi:hypothetical protein